jgi:hypothetical protein
MRFKRSIQNDMASQMDAQFGAPRNKGAEAINQLVAKSLFSNPRARSRMESLGYALDQNTGMLVRPNSMANKARGTMSSANRAAMGGMY